jgi:pseudouridine kinase
MRLTLDCGPALGHDSVAVLNAELPVSHARPPSRFVCIGGAVIDHKLRALAPIRAATSNPSKASSGFGGVARNVAEALARLGGDVSLVSAVGSDPQGAEMIAHLDALGIHTGAVMRIAGAATASYVALLEPDGVLHVAASDMGVLEATYGGLLAHLPALAADADWLFADCNAPAATLAALLAEASARGWLLALDAISVPKAVRLPADLSGVACLCLNHDEAVAVLGAQDDDRAMALALSRRGAARVVLTHGAEGLIVCEDGRATHVPAQPAEVVDVTGAGDALIAGVLTGLAAGWSLHQAARFGTRLAARTVASELSVDASLSPALREAFIAEAVAIPGDR